MDFFEELGDVLDIFDNTGLRLEADFAAFAASFFFISSIMAGVGLSRGILFSMSSTLDTFFLSGVFPLVAFLAGVRKGSFSLFAEIAASFLAFAAACKMY